MTFTDFFGSTVWILWNLEERCLQEPKTNDLSCLSLQILILLVCAGYCCCCMHSWFMACSCAHTIFLAFALGYSECLLSVFLTIILQRWQFRPECFYFFPWTDDSAMAKYSFVRHTCMLLFCLSMLLASAAVLFDLMSLMLALLDMLIRYVFSISEMVIYWIVPMTLLSRTFIWWSSSLIYIFFLVSSFLANGDCLLGSFISMWWVKQKWI